MEMREPSGLYLSGRVQVLTGTVLPRELLERMAAAEGEGEALRMLAEGGVAPEEGASAAKRVARRQAELLNSFAGAEEGRAIVELFRIPYDAHNAKVLLKANLTGASPEGLLSPCGGVSPERLQECIEGGTAAGLPAWLRHGLEAARRSWTGSRSVQLVDVAMDQACFAGMKETARRSGSAAAERYVRLCIDGINLQTVLRMKDAAPGAVEELLLPGGDAAPGRILDALSAGTLAAAFSRPALRAAAEGGNAFAAARAFAGELRDFAGTCRRRPYGPETLLGFFLMLELHSAAARLILAEQQNGGAEHDREHPWDDLL